MNKESRMVPMRDGVRLYTEIYKPVGDGSWPVILCRTIYSFEQMNPACAHENKVNHGYVSVIQNSRGFYSSEGEYCDPTCECDDAYDMIDWLIKQPWCDGNIGMSGMSYNGYTQFAAASSRHPNLKMIIPEYAATVFSGLGFHDRGIGAMSEIFWGAEQTQKTLSSIGKTEELKEYVLSSRENMQNISLSRQPEYSEEPHKSELADKIAQSVQRNSDAVHRVLKLPLYEEVNQTIELCPWTEVWFREVDNPEFFSSCDYTKPDNTPQIPVLQLTGWYDHFIKDAFKLFNANRKNGVCHKLIVTPNTHLMTYGPELPPIGKKRIEYEFVNDSIMTSKLPPSVGTDCCKKWMEHWLKGVSNDVEDQAPITLFVQGANVFRDEYEWPLARTQWTPLYFYSYGSAGTSLQDGGLSFEQQNVGCADCDEYVYDPTNPVPTLGGQFAPIGQFLPGIFEQSDVEKREDVLIYTSQPLEKELEITGPLKVILYASTSAVDTDFVATLTVVDPDDTSWNVAFGICRLRHRPNHQGLVTPNKVQKVEIELTPTSYLLAKGKRLRVQITSSNFPSIDPNPNTGKSLWNDSENEMIIAKQMVYHTSEYPSHLLLPVIPL